jgi:cell division septum initiation protein DivIVA
VGVQDRLDALTSMVEEARSMPMSASCIVNRAEVLELLDEVRAALPDSLAEAERVLLNRRGVVDEGKAEAKDIIDAAYAEQARLVSESEVLRQADIEAERIVHEAQAEGERMRQEVDDYVDARLAHFEVLLEKTLGTVHRGRVKLAGVDEKDELAPEARTGAEAPDAEADDAGAAAAERSDGPDRGDRSA